MLSVRAVALALAAYLTVLGTTVLAQSRIGREVSVAHHLQEGEEFTIPLRDLLEHGKRLFVANWTREEGGGRPLTKGTGALLSDPSAPLVFPRNFNRISAPDANSCAGCHNAPFGIAGGGGDIVANVFVLGQRFDFATMNQIPDGFTTKGTSDETGAAVNIQSVANSRNTLGMVGSGTSKCERGRLLQTCRPFATRFLWAVPRR